MTDHKPDLTFNCPHCGAPLEPQAGVRSIICPYCNNSVVIPKELRTRAPKAPAPVPPLTPARRGLSMGCLRLIISTVLAFVLIVFSLGFMAYQMVKDWTKDIPGVSSITSGFARVGLTFGSKGTGPGMFSDVRSVAMDASGNILTGDYEDGRVQTFSPSGKYRSTFNVAGGVDYLTVGPDGKIYTIHNGNVSIYDSSGKEIGKVEAARGADALAFGADGSMFVLTDGDQVKRFDSAGNLTLTIHDAFSSVLGAAESTQYIAVDGIGNIYIVGDYGCKVLKYSPSGQYLDQFSGKAPHSGPAIPGTVFNPSGIGVDGYGRVFVSDWNTDVQVFDSNGTPIQSVDALTLGLTTLIYGMNLDNNGKIYLALADKIMELNIQAP
jgi:sugar lactone lactonase YvrE